MVVITFLLTLSKNEDQIDRDVNLHFKLSVQLLLVNQMTAIVLSNDI
jgi:hypothetical protein